MTEKATRAYPQGAFLQSLIPLFRGLNRGPHLYSRRLFLFLGVLFDILVAILYFPKPYLDELKQLL